MRLLLIALIAFAGSIPVAFGLQPCSAVSCGGRVLAVTGLVGFCVWQAGRIDLGAAARSRVPPLRALAAMSFEAFPSCFALLGSSLWGILGGAVAYSLASAAEFDLVDRWAWMVDRRRTHGFNLGQPSSSNFATITAIGWTIAGLSFFAAMAMAGGMTWLDAGHGAFSQAVPLGSSDGSSIIRFAVIAGIFAAFRKACSLGLVWLRFGMKA